MAVVISYDVSNEKQAEFKNWLMKNKGYRDREQNPNGLVFPESTLIRPSVGNNPNNDTLTAKAEMIAAAQAVNSKIETGVICSTGGTLLPFKWPE